MRNGADIGCIIAGTVFTSIALIIGLVFGGIGVHFRNEAETNEERLNDFKEYAERTKGEVVEAEDGTTIEYMDEDGEEYRISFNITSSSIYEGKKVIVYYDEDDPDDAMVPEIDVDFNRLFGNIFFFVGVGVAGVFGTIGIILIVSGIGIFNKAKKGKAAGTETIISSNVSQVVSSNAAPKIYNDIPVNVTVSEAPKSDYSGVDKNLL